MLSYQHIYHAGNAADLQKHLWLITVLDYLRQKDKPLCWFDTHAGRGLYDLHTPEAQKLAEHRTGAEPAFEARRQFETAPAPLRQYFELLEGLNPEGALSRYPGSALIAARMQRPADRLMAFDMHKGEYPHLAQAMTPYKNVKTAQDDGLQRLLKLIPPAERRGGALIDPSYEIKTEYTQVLDTLKNALKKWQTGVYMIWYPLLPAGHHTALTEGAKALECEIVIDEWIWRSPSEGGRGLYGSGMIIVNPPYTCAQTMEQTKALLLPLLGAGPQNTRKG